MAIPPPPYANITGTSQIVAKYNEQESIANVDGNARPGQLIVDLETDPPQLYVGNNTGNITLVASGGVANTGNILFDGNDIYPNNSSFPHIYGGPSGGPELTYLEEAGNFASYSQTMYINGGGLYVSLDYGNVEMVYSPDGNLTLDGNIITTGSSGNITGANVIQANTFASNGNLYITPDLGSPASALDVYLTGGPDVHIATTNNLIVGKDVGANVTVGSTGYVAVQAYDVGNSLSRTWWFGTLGTFESPITIYANLPSPTTAGLRAFINDANLVASGNFGALLTGGAGNTVPVYSDGSNWRIG